MIESLRAENAALRAANADLERIASEHAFDLQRVRHQLAVLERRLFGRSSEKISPHQLLFLDGLAAPAVEDVPDDEAKGETTPETRKKRAHGRKPLPADLPRERVVYEIPEEDRICSGCQVPMQPFAEDVTDELDYIPARLFVRQHVRPKYSCRMCQQGVVQAPLPPRPIEKGRPGPGLLAQVLVAKYVDHLPIYRQAKIFLRHGIDLSDSTLCDWVGAAIGELSPIVAELAKKVIASKVVAADETPIVVLEEHNGKRRRLGWLWVYRGLGGETVFDYRPSRGREGPQEFLRTYRGYLQRDGYQGYRGLPDGIVEVGCWAHARRKFYEALSSSATQARGMIDLIRRLYAVEDDARHLEPSARAALRREKSAPVIEAIAERLDALHASALPRSPLGMAVGYARSQWPTLVRHLEDGDVAIDNNVVENCIRGVALGRKNWLFAGSAAGAKRAADIYSLIESCKSIGVDPFEYLSDILTRTTTATAAQLLPRAWQAARAQAASALSAS